MLLFGHMGLTLAAARMVERVWSSRTGRAFIGLDYRLVLLGSMLPDILDKPLGGVILRESLGNGRIYGHTLAFLLVLLGWGWWLWFRFRRPGGLTLAGASGLHQFLDGMWHTPETSLWPAYGLGFPKGHPEGWFELWLRNLTSDPLVYIPEIAGGAVLLLFFWDLTCRKGLAGFIRTGRIRPAPREES
ncbi:MAG: hypothetical protein PWP65_2152 [Clostridia bacterium]|nr:hypothetical protein [Clostridia bacterium]